MLGDAAIGSSAYPRRLLLPIFGLLLLFHSGLAHAQAVVKVNDTVSVRFGILAQPWLDELQDATTRGYGQNLYLRRMRFLVTGQVAPNVTFFFQTDNPNLGKAPKALGSGFLIQDAWVEWKFRDEFALEGGEFIVPLNRLELVSSASSLGLDISPTATVFSAPTTSNGNRDTGFQAKGYIADGRLEYRGAILQGIREAGARNAFRKTVYFNYDFWEKERGYTYAGTSLGKKKILALSGGYDKQRDYKAYSANFTAQVPIAGGHEFATQIQGVHYDGGTFIKTLPRQNDFVGEFGYYIAPYKLQPFAKIEEQNFSTTTSAATTDLRRYGFGANYYASGQNCKLTGQFLHIVPKGGAIKSTNEFTVQLQVWYY